MNVGAEAEIREDKTISEAEVNNQRRYEVHGKKRVEIITEDSNMEAWSLLPRKRRKIPKDWKAAVKKIKQSGTLSLLLFMMPRMAKIILNNYPKSDDFSSIYDLCHQQQIRHYVMIIMLRYIRFNSYSIHHLVYWRPSSSVNQTNPYKHS